MRGIVKKIKILLITGALLITVPLTDQAQEPDRSKYFELENGLKVFLLEKRNLPLLNIAFAFNLGSKDETEETSGLVHILEHYTLFRGTELRTGEEVVRELREHGAYFNAHTDRDLILFDLTLPSEYADFALNNQKEILFQLNLDQEELNKEKKVILEELSQTKDDPFKYGTSLAFQNLFQNHPYHRPIYGNKDIIQAATAEQLGNFYRRYFVPANGSLAIVGDFRIEDMEKKVKDIFGSLENREISPKKIETIQKLKKTIEIEHEMDVNQAYLIIGMLAPDYNHPDQYAADVLTEIMGRGVSPLLNAALRGKRNLAHSIFMSYTSLKYGGAMLIYLTCDPKHLKSAKSKTLQFLKTTRRQNYSKKDYPSSQRLYAFDFLECSQNQIRFASRQSQEEGLSVARSLARYMLLKEGESKGGYLEEIEDINSSDCRNAAGKYLGQGKYVIVSIRPKEK